MINAFVSTRIHQNSVYRYRSPCAFIGNTTWSIDASIQSCIWECVHTFDCQTAVYFQDQKICTMFSELCEHGTIEPADNVSASVICYRKNLLSESHRSCSSTASTAHSDKDTTSEMKVTTSSEPDTTTMALSSESNAASFWSFDNHTLDSLAGFHGTPMGNPTYKTPGINGYGAALSLDRNRQQYVQVNAYRNLANRSFTVEMWFYCTNLTYYQQGLLGQYQYLNTSHFLHYQILHNITHLGFYDNDAYGSTEIEINTWYHVAFIYDFSLLHQVIYLKGILDGRGSAQAYQGTSGPINIGRVGESFSGYIDEVYLIMRAKNASEILDDATLVCWHSFANGSYNDAGPLRLNGIGENISFVSGRRNEAINFTFNSSYYQIGGFVLLGLPKYPYSISLWICPLSINDSTLVHASTEKNGQGWILDLIRFCPSGNITLAVSNNSYENLVGPVLSLNAWTHIVHTYSTINGIRLYLNGTLKGSANSTMRSVSNQVNILTLGNTLQANSGNVYRGLIDEFRVYSRELNATDIQTLANL